MSKRLTLKQVRKSKGLTLRELSEATGVSETNLSFIERGKTKPTATTIKKIAGVLGLTYEELFDMLYM